MIDTDRSQALIGFVKDSGKELTNLSADIENDFASVILSSTGSEAIDEAEELLLAVTAKFELTDMQYNEEGTELLKWGGKPGLIEPVTGTIQIKGLKNVRSAEVVAIGGDGNRLQSRVTTSEGNGSVRIEVGDPATTLYLVKINR